MMLRRWIMAAGLISAVLLSGAEQDEVPLLRWAGPPGTRPGTFREWIALHPYTDFSYTLDKRVTGDGKAGTVAIITEQSIAPSLTAEINQLINNLQLEGYTVGSYQVLGGTPEDLRSFLQGLHTTDNIEGALFIGNLPIAWFQIENDFDTFGYREWPIDLYYMDIDGSWYDTLKQGPGNTLIPGQDSIYDQHSGHLAPEIYIGRLLPTGIGDDTLLIKNYFYKNNAFRQGIIELQHRALVYVDDDWIPWAPRWAADVALLYSDTLLIFDANTTRASDYRVRLDTVRAWVAVFAHSWPAAHVFDYNNQTQKDYYWSTEYTSQNPPANFYNFFACSFTRYTTAGYGGGRAIFNASHGVGSIGSTKIGSMLDFWAFYQPLSQGKTMGEAFRDWFTHIASDGITFMELCWHYGMTLLGDPFLRPTGHPVGIPEIPAVFKLFDCEILPDTLPTFDFSTTDPQGDPVQYQIFWDTDPGFASPASELTGNYNSGDTASYQLTTSLMHDSTYWFKVRAKDPMPGSGHYSDWSDVRSFTVDTTISHSAWYMGVRGQWENCARRGLIIEGDSVVLRSNILTTLLSESFETTTFPPTGWAKFVGSHDETGTADDWERRTNESYPAPGASAGITWSAAADTTDKFLATPILNLSQVVGTELLFYSRNQYVTFYKYHGIWASTGAQTDTSHYTEVQSILPTADNTWEPRTVALSVYDGNPSVYFAFRYKENDGTNWWVDSVLIRATTTGDSGEIISPPIVFTNFSSDRVSWGKVFWNKQLAADSIGMRVERRDAGSWVTAIPDTFIMTTAACSIDISSLGTTDTIRLVGRFYKGTPKASIEPVLKDWSVTYIPTDTDISERDIPFIFALSQNHPNPFSAKTVIKFTVHGSQFTGKNRQLLTVNCQLKIYDLAGRVVRTLLDERKKPGHYLVEWDGRDDRGRKVASGIYFYRLRAGEFVKTQKMVRIQ